MSYYPAIDKFWAENHKRFELPTDFRILAFPIALIAIALIAMSLYSFLGIALGAFGLFIIVGTKELTPWLKSIFKDISAGGLFYKKDGNVQWLLNTSPNRYGTLSEFDLNRVKKTASKIEVAVAERKADLSMLKDKGFDEKLRITQLENAEKCMVELRIIIDAWEKAKTENSKSREAQAQEAERGAVIERERKKHIQQQRKVIQDELDTLNLAKKSGLLDSEEYDKQNRALMIRLGELKNI